MKWGEWLGEIIIKNLTAMSDAAALIRLGLYMMDVQDAATEGGYRFRREESETIAGKNVIVFIERDG